MVLRSQPGFERTPLRFNPALPLSHYRADTMVSAYRGNEKIVVDKSTLTRVAKRSLQLHTGLAACHLKDKHSGPCVAISIRDGNKSRGDERLVLRLGEMMGFLH